MKSLVLDFAGEINATSLSLNHMMTRFRNFALFFVGTLAWSVGHAADSCPTSYRYGDGLGAYEIIFAPLAQKTHSRAILEEIHQRLKACTDPNNGPYMEYVRWDSRLGEPSSSGPMEDTMICYSREDQNQSPEDYQIEAMLARFKAYECSRNAGWPMATDSQEVIAARDGTATSKTARPTASSGKHAAETSPSVLQRSAEARVLAQQYAAEFERMAAASDVAQAEGADNGRKRLVLKQHPQCLRAVDIRLDSTVKTMYWYSIENICSETLVAHWCTGSQCKQPTYAATLPGGAKQQSWMDTRSKGSVKFRGTACQETYQGQRVYYDKAQNQCWLWSQ